VPATCAACIEAAGTIPKGIQLVMAGPVGLAAGLGMKTGREMRHWLDTLEETRCPCMHPLPAYYSPDEIRIECEGFFRLPETLPADA
jgi:hypothetical protein